MAVAFIPFPTGVVAENGSRTGTIFYALSIALAGLLTAAGWEYASRARLVDPHVTTHERNSETLRLLIVPGMFLVSIALAFIAPNLARLAWLLTIPLTLLIRNV